MKVSKIIYSICTASAVLGVSYASAREAQIITASRVPAAAAFRMTPSTSPMGAQNGMMAVHPFAAGEVRAAQRETGMIDAGANFDPTAYGRQAIWASPSLTHGGGGYWGETSRPGLGSRANAQAMYGQFGGVNAQAMYNANGGSYLPGGGAALTSYQTYGGSNLPYGGTGLNAYQTYGGTNLGTFRGNLGSGANALAIYGQNEGVNAQAMYVEYGGANLPGGGAALNSYQTYGGSNLSAF